MRKRRVHQPKVYYDGTGLVQSHGVHVPHTITIHDTEGHDTKGIGDLQGLASFWHGQGLGYGAQIAIDSQGMTGRYVADNEVAYHTGMHNTGFLGIEMIGFARFTLAMWLDRPHQLATCAKWIAYWSKEYDIPIRRSIEHGVTTHRRVSERFPQDTNHRDPGLGFPLRGVLMHARYLREHGW